MDKSLRLQVLFAGIDKLTAPMRRMREGTKGLAASVETAQRELLGLKRAEAQLASYKGAENRLKSTSAELAEARAKTEALRREIAQVDAPTKRMTAALTRAEAAEKKVSARHEEQGAKLQELTGKLRTAGVEVDDMARSEARLGDRIRATSRQLEIQRERTERMDRLRARGERMKEMGGKVSGAGAIGSATVTAPIVALAFTSMEAARESAQALGQVAAAQTSMGNKSKRTTQQLQDQAGALEQLSLFDDDDILVGLTANLLTFGNVSGRVFDRAQLAAVNMSARLGQSLQTSGIQLGKALNAPVKGVAALSKVGVQFSSAQKDQIAKLVKAGQIAKAQGIILSELESQFAGAAAAQRAASPDAAAQQAWRGFQETVGAVAIKHLPPLLNGLDRLLTRFNKLDPGTQSMILGAVALAAVLPPLMIIIGGLMTVVGGVAGVFAVGFLPAIAIILAITAAVGVFAYLAYAVYQNWGNVTRWWGEAWASLKARVSGFVGWLRGTVPSWGQVGRMMLQGLLNGLSPLALVRHVLKLGSLAISGIKKVLGINSPSRVFAEIGGHMMGGLRVGLDRAADAPLGRLRRAGAELTAAMAGGVLAASPVAAADRPALAARAGGPGDARGAAPAIGVVTIHIHQQPGQSGADLAQQLSEELKRRGLAAEAARRSSFEDD